MSNSSVTRAGGTSDGTPNDSAPNDSLTISTDAVVEFARRLDELATDIENWVIRARTSAVNADPNHRAVLGPISQRCSRTAEQSHADSVRAQHVAGSYETHESWWAGPSGWAGLAVAGIAAFASPTGAHVSAFRRAMTGLSGLAAGLVAPAFTAARVAGLSGSPLSAHPVVQSPCRTPTSFDDAVARIPPVAPGQAQVRIEKTPATTFVYIGGTATGDFFGGREPWDMSSNILAMGGQTSDSERGVRRAISAAGVSTSDRIVIVGHSQGGLLAQRIAADPTLNVHDVVLVGSPQSPEGVPGNVHVVALENRNDPITALGGAPNDTRADVTGARTPTIGAGDALAAHHLEAYRELARDLDASSNPAAVNAQRQMFSADNGACQATDWRIERVRNN